jgi:hypothetical protein
MDGPPGDVGKVKACAEFEGQSSLTSRSAEWLCRSIITTGEKIERSLNLHDEEAEIADLSPYHGVISLTEDPLAYQARIRNEWS